MTTDPELQKILDQVAGMDSVRLPMGDGSAIVVSFTGESIVMYVTTDESGEGTSLTCKLQSRGAMIVGGILTSFGERIALLGESGGRTLN